MWADTIHMYLKLIKISKGCVAACTATGGVGAREEEREGDKTRAFLYKKVPGWVGEDVFMEVWDNGEGEGGASGAQCIIAGAAQLVTSTEVQQLGMAFYMNEE
eukprot:gb/GEZN01013097.1/.p3 GENE.gb/GEZN01013097.1/~~gb/GEZN01013097.1/.p3  ORF type:complete len:103 (-),score=21.48 gb/GEZN01013097.1/:288-596(-)